MKKKNVVRFFAKYWISIWLVVIILLTAIVSVFAIYADTHNKIKRVVAPSANIGSLFTSNYLSNEENVIKSAYFSSMPYTFDVFIRNYHPTDPNRFFHNEIPYTLSVQLAHRNGTPYDSTLDAAMLDGMTESNQSIAIVCGTGDNTDAITLDGLHLSGNNTKSHTLSGKDNGTDRWTVTFNSIPIGSDICLKMTATPAEGLDLDTLSATICIDPYPETYHEGWSCTLVENVSGANVSVFDAFNYTIIGTGEKTIKFSYDSTKLEINPACYLHLSEISNPTSYSGSNSRGSDWKTVTISANPNVTGVNRYDIQLYKVYDNDAKESYQPTSFSEITPNSDGGFVEFE